MEILFKTHRKLCIKRLTIQANVGVYAHERARSQAIWISIDAWVKLEHTLPQQDHLDAVVDYDFLRHTALKFAHECHHALLETLSEKILDEVLTHPRIDAVRLLIEKPDIFDDCESIGIETYREKSMLGHLSPPAHFC